MMNEETAAVLRALAARYETEGFLTGDPSWFMHQVSDESNQEVTAFVASALSYGSRAQFLPKISRIMEWATYGGVANVAEWVRGGAFEADLGEDAACFYRLYNNGTMRSFLRALQRMLQEYGSMRQFVVSTVPAYSTPGVGVLKRDAMRVIEQLTAWFAAQGSTCVVPKDTKSSCKRLAMFLRWMVRDGSPVDLGLWSDLIDRRTLVVPMDTHVVQEACRLGLLTSKSASMSSARRLTDALRLVWPDDPLRGDFALFGLGVDFNGR